jgi:hypothetical protein
MIPDVKLQPPIPSITDCVKVGAKSSAFVADA